MTGAISKEEKCQEETAQDHPRKQEEAEKMVVVEASLELVKALGLKLVARREPASKEVTNGGS